MTRIASWTSEFLSSSSARPASARKPLARRTRNEQVDVEVAAPQPTLQPPVWQNLADVASAHMALEVLRKRFAIHEHLLACLSPVRPCARAQMDHQAVLGTGPRAYRQGCCADTSTPHRPEDSLASTTLKPARRSPSENPPAPAKRSTAVSSRRGRAEAHFRRLDPTDTARCSSQVSFSHYSGLLWMSGRVRCSRYPSLSRWSLIRRAIKVLFLKPRSSQYALKSIMLLLIQEHRDLVSLLGHRRIPSDVLQQFHRL